MENNLDTKKISYIDNDPQLFLETNSSFKKLVNIFLIPILNNLPKNFKKVIKKTNKAAGEVIDNATNHQALEVLYNKGVALSKKRIMKTIFQSIWFNLDNSKAVRNRLKFVRRELTNQLKLISTYDREINIISIATGSSRAIIETINSEQIFHEMKVSITFLDKNEHAITYSKKMSQAINCPNIRFEWINDTVGNFFKNKQQKKYDIVEIVGLLDYFTDAKVTETFKNIHNILEEGGIVITANINHNREEKFVTNVIDWPMIYRSADELGVLLNAAGFKYNNMNIFYEPLRIHGLIKAKK